MAGGSGSSLPARDLLDVRLSAAFESDGCPFCAVRARSERAMLDTIISERVLDIPFREALERREGFCRRHLRELIVADRASTGGMLGSSILYGAMLHRRMELVRGAAAAKGRSRTARTRLARQRPPCIACGQGASAVETALGRAVERAKEPAWAAAIGEAAMCVDDVLAFIDAAGDAPAAAPVLRRQIERLTDLEHRLAGFIDHSAYDRRHGMTDLERTAGNDAADTLGGTDREPRPR
jgi:Family of unknown function (DUF6062)